METSSSAALQHSADSSSNTAGLGEYFALGIVALLSAFGWYAVEKWVTPTDTSAKLLLSILKTVFVLLPALAAFIIANNRQRKIQLHMAAELDRLKALLTNYYRLQSVDHELKTMDRLSKVARNAVMTTAASSKELFGAIEAVPDETSKKLLLERYRYHTNSVVTILLAVNEQLSESGKAISENITADDQIDIVKRASLNIENGMRHAHEMIEKRGINDGLGQLSRSIDQALSLQNELSSTVQALESTAN